MAVYDMIIKEIITKDEMLDMQTKSPNYHHKKCMKYSEENIYIDSRA